MSSEAVRAEGMRAVCRFLSAAGASRIDWSTNLAFLDFDIYDLDWLSGPDSKLTGSKSAWPLTFWSRSLWSCTESWPPFSDRFCLDSACKAPIFCEGFIRTLTDCRRFSSLFLAGIRGARSGYCTKYCMWQHEDRVTKSDTRFDTREHVMYVMNRFASNAKLLTPAHNKAFSCNGVQTGIHISIQALHK